MSIQLMSAAYRLDIPSSPKFVLIMLCDHADARGYCWPSQARLAKETNLSVRTVRTCIHWLIEAGYLKKLSTGNGSGKSSEYIVKPAKAEAVAALEQKGGNLRNKGGNLQQKRRKQLPPNHQEPSRTTDIVNKDRKAQPRKLSDFLKTERAKRPVH